MDRQNFDKEKLIKYWIDQAMDDNDTMIAMYDSKRYNWALFLGHLMIEKLLKAYYVKINSEYPPLIHNLLRLAEKSNLDINEEKKKELVTITAFNINARYDDYSSSFKQLCTLEFTDEWISKIDNLKIWIKGLIIQ